VTTEDLAVVGDVAHATDVAIHELRSEQTHLEELFFNLTETESDRNRLAGATTTRRPAPEPAVTGAAGAHGLSSALPPDLPPPSGPPVDPSAVAAPTADAKESGR
jgi:ABC-2 type transport system ATP-binding protein